MSTPRRSEFVRGPKWRTRTTPRRRHGAAAATMTFVVVVGLVTMWALLWLLARLGAPGGVRVAVWALPTAAVALWTVVRATPADLTDDDDDSWFGYATRWLLVGELVRRPMPLRIAVAAVLGGPIGWALVLGVVLTLLGVI